VFTHISRDRVSGQELLTWLDTAHAGVYLDFMSRGCHYFRVQNLNYLASMITVISDSLYEVGNMLALFK